MSKESVARESDRIAALETERDAYAAALEHAYNFIDMVKDTSEDVGQDAEDFIAGYEPPTAILAERDKGVRRKALEDAEDEASTLRMYVHDFLTHVRRPPGLDSALNATVQYVWLRLLELNVFPKASA